MSFCTEHSTLPPTGGIIYCRYSTDTCDTQKQCRTMQINLSLNKLEKMHRYAKLIITYKTYLENLFLLFSCCNFLLTLCYSFPPQWLFSPFLIITVHFHFHFAFVITMTMFVSLSITRFTSIKWAPATTFDMPLRSTLRRLQVNTIWLPVRVLCWLTKYRKPCKINVQQY